MGFDVKRHEFRGVALLAALSLSVAACASAGATTRPVAGPPASDNPFQIGRTLVIPHAGGDGLFPENTVYAYQQSNAMGGDVVDIDVRLSADGVPMAIHDATVDRTTDASGFVADLTALELGRLDAGWAFERDGNFPFRGQGFGIPTVEDILREFPTKLTTLDLKDRSNAPVGPVCEMLRRLGRTNDVYVGTETNEQVLAFRATCPELHTSGTREERTARRSAQDAGDSAIGAAQLVSQPSFIGRDGERRVTEESLAFAHNSGTAILTWVVDDREDMADLIALGVDGIYTRRPDVLIDVLRDMGQLET